ncbi:DUF192 domain-containing protein [Patescibacteria group bacterium]
MTKERPKSKLLTIYKNKYFRIGLSAGLIVIILLIWGIFSQIDPLKYKTKKISINGTEIQVQTADTSWKHTKGLGDRYSLDEDNGMLFEFDRLDNYTFIMRDMKFDLDILWVNDDKVVHYEKFIPRDSEEKFESIAPANKVLEVNAGWIEKHNIGIGATYQEL